MPQLGETVAEGKITKWFVKSGDRVKPGDNLFEIETDKTSMEVPATEAGTLTDIRFEVGQVAKVGAVVAVISGGRSNVTGQAATGAPPKAPAARDQAPAAPSYPTPRTANGGPGGASFVPPPAPNRAYPQMDPFREVRTPERNHGPARLPGGITVTPLARRLAGERGIDLGNLKGSGPRGRIIASDIERAPVSAAQFGGSAADVRALYAGVAYDEVPIAPMRAIIARRLTEAKQSVPHFYLSADIDVDRLVALREQANASIPGDRDEATSKISLNDFIIKAWASALQRVPEANSVWAGDRILRFKSSDIGVAVALDDGLITPIIRNAEQKSLTTISREMRDLAARARDKKLKPEDYQGGASAISNLGMYGVREFSAIINPPHATILAVGASRRAPVEAEDGSVKFVSQMTVTLSCDHRVVDGALGAQLLGAFKQLIENPITALI